MAACCGSKRDRARGETPMGIYTVGPGSSWHKYGGSEAAWTTTVSEAVYIPVMKVKNEFPRGVWTACLDNCSLCWIELLLLQSSTHAGRMEAQVSVSTSHKKKNCMQMQRGCLTWCCLKVEDEQKARASITTLVVSSWRG